jgi:hypothetical protein
MYIMSPIREHWQCAFKAPLERACPVVLFDEKNYCLHRIAPSSSHTCANKYHGHANNIMAHKWGQGERERARLRHKSIDETGLSPRAVQQASTDFLELGAKIHGTELMPRPHHASSHVNDMQKMTLDLGARRVSLAPIITVLRSGSIF